MRFSTCGHLALSAIVLAITACGGGTEPIESNAPPTARLNVTAATGAPFVGAVVTVTDSTGATVGTSGPVGENGVVSIVLEQGAQAPLVVTATRTNADGEVVTMVSVARSLEAGSTSDVNVTPVTTLIASLLSPSGDPARLAQEVGTGGAQLNEASITEKVNTVQGLLQPLLQAAGVGATDPLSGSFAPDGTGYDRMLDSLVVQIVPASATTANITVAAKDGAGPQVQFPSNAPPQGQTVAAALAPEQVMPRINAFLQRLQACYALPLAQRMRAGVPITDGLARGATAADVAATECAQVFWQQDPTRYLHNGQRVGSRRDVDGYNGLFSERATGVVYSRGSYEYAIPNTDEPGAPDDIVVSFKARTVDGNESFHTEVLRADDDGVLRLRGNQYKYAGGILPAQVWREFVNSPQYSYLATGYRVAVRTQLDRDGRPILDRVEVTTPGERIWPTLRPQSGQSYLVMNGLTASIRLNHEFEQPELARAIATVPELEPRQIFARDKYSDDDILKEKITGKFTFKYFLAGNTGNVPDAVQYYRLRTRPLTIAEMRARAWPQLNPALLAAYRANGDALTGAVPAPNAGPADLGVAAWSVADGALPVTSVTLWGRPSGSMASYSDSVTVRSTERTAVVACSSVAASDTHCAGGAGGGFVDGYGFDVIELHGTDQAGGDFGKLYAFRKIAD